MTDNILIWSSGPDLYFCMSYYLQKNYDTNLSIIFDVTNRPKSFFEKQKIINFNKIWFYHDHISKNYVVNDRTYLKEFETRFDIDLWKLAINERFFLPFNEFHHFTTDEILSILEQECKLFEKVLANSKPDFFITADPSSHHHRLFYEMCRKLKIPTLILHPLRIGNKHTISEEAEVFDPAILSEFESTHTSAEYLREHYLFFDRQKQQEEFSNKLNSSSIFLLKAAFSYLFSANSNTRTHYTYFGRNKLKVIMSYAKVQLKKKYRKRFIDQNLTMKPDLDVDFAYLPLHIEMEQYPLITAPFYTNQIEIIKQVAKSLPIGYRLYVKEHPSQGARGWRSISEYKEIMNIPNVYVINPSFPSTNLHRNCAFTITISGSAGLDAAFYEKPSLVFTDLHYSFLPNVYRIKSIEEISKIIKRALTTKVSTEQLTKYLQFIEQNSFDFDYIDFLFKINQTFYKGGFLVDTEISSEQFLDFLKNNTYTLENIAQMHIKKIQLCKKE